MGRKLIRHQKLSLAQSLSSNLLFCGLAILAVLAVVIVSNGMSFAGENAQVEIVAAPKSGKGPIWVHLSPKIRNVNEPVKIEWSFGDGKTSNEKQPGFHLFEFGRYSVVLEVIDRKGKRYTASITIDASTPG